MNTAVCKKQVGDDENAPNAHDMKTTTKHIDTRYYRVHYKREATNEPLLSSPEQQHQYLCLPALSLYKSHVTHITHFYFIVFIFQFSIQKNK